MELNIPAIHGVGTSRIYFVDRYEQFSIYDVDFVPIPGVDPHPPAIAGLHFFGIVQYIGNDRTDDWTEFYRELFGFSELPAEQRFGILPKGRILRSPCPPASRFYIQLIEPEAGVLDVEDDEGLQRIGLGTRRRAGDRGRARPARRGICRIARRAHRGPRRADAQPGWAA